MAYRNQCRFVAEKASIYLTTWLAVCCVSQTQCPPSNNPFFFLEINISKYQILKIYKNRTILFRTETSIDRFKCSEIVKYLVGMLQALYFSFFSSLRWFLGLLHPLCPPRSLPRSHVWRLHEGSVQQILPHLSRVDQTQTSLSRFKASNPLPLKLMKKHQATKLHSFSQFLLNIQNRRRKRNPDKTFYSLDCYCFYHFYQFTFYQLPDIMFLQSWDTVSRRFWGSKIV